MALYVAVPRTEVIPPHTFQRLEYIDKMLTIMLIVYPLTLGIGVLLSEDPLRLVGSCVLGGSSVLVGSGLIRHAWVTIPTTRRSTRAWD